MARKNKTKFNIGFQAFPLLSPGHGAIHFTGENKDVSRCNSKDCERGLSQRHFQNPVEKLAEFYEEKL